MSEHGTESLDYSSDRVDDEPGSKAGYDTGASYGENEPPSGRNRHQVSAQTLQQNMTEF